MSLEKDKSTFRILVATDIHLGYQHDRNKGKLLYDSFVTFEEILQYGKDYEVDFVLLGGDLFHDTKPSQAALIECMDLLRKYCFGPGAIKMELLTDPDLIFEHCRYKTANYEDPNININMPLFTIHGNHDDPSFSTVGSMDLLSVSGLINYFGKCTSLDEITINPIILKKGTTHIALYGLSYINDQRLNRLIKHSKLKLNVTPELENDLFHILVLHQNRTQHSQNDFVPESKLPPFLNLVIWGHEHECRITPEVVSGQRYQISQPGSSIATSLCESEAVPKHVGILYVNNSQYKMKKLKLKTVRPFVFDTINLHNNPEIEEKKSKRASSKTNIIFEYVDNYIENELLSKAKKQLTGHPKQPKEPLIRLRLFYNDEKDVFETTGLSQKYCDKVANPMTMILFRKIATSSSKSSKNSSINASLDDISEKFQFDDEEKSWTNSVQECIKEYFDIEGNKDLLKVLSVTGLNETLSQYIIKADEDAIHNIIMNKINKTKEYIKKQNVVNPEDIIDKMKEYRDKMNEMEDEERRDVINLMNNKSSKTSTREIYNDINDGDDIILAVDDNIDDNGKQLRNVGKGKAKESTRGRGRGRGRGNRGTTAKSSTSATSKKTPISVLLKSTPIHEQEKQARKQPAGHPSLGHTRNLDQRGFMEYSDSD